MLTNFSQKYFIPLQYHAEYIEKLSLFISKLKNISTI